MLHRNRVAVHLRPHGFHFVAVQVLAVRHGLVDQSAWRDFNNAVRHGVQNLVIVRSIDHIADKFLHTVVEGRDRFEV